MAQIRKVRPLTDKQRAAWEFIDDFSRRYGYPPTIREIGERFKIGTTNGVRTMLEALEKKGFIKRRPFKSRGLELLKHPYRMELPEASENDITRIPIVGRVAAGLPLLAEQNIEGELTLDKSLFPTGDGFALRVTGNSMIEAGINDGDFVLTRPDLPIENGMIVVALIGDEATVKYFHSDFNQIKLIPANPDYNPIVIDANDEKFKIVGKVVGLFRRY